MQPTEIIAELIMPNNGDLSQCNILLKTTDGSALHPQHILDAVTDLLLIEYGPFLPEIVDTGDPKYDS